MAKDFVLFIHGVTVRNNNYANRIIQVIQKRLITEEKYEIDASQLLNKDKKIVKHVFSKRDLDGNKVHDVVLLPLFWGDIPEKQIEQKLNNLTNQPTWKYLDFKDIRLKSIMPFAGDATLFINEQIGPIFIKKMVEDAKDAIGTIEPGDRLHLVTHSWGTIILFDFILSQRWLFKNNGTIEDETKFLFEFQELLFDSLILESVITMGSPIFFFEFMQAKRQANNDKARENFIKILIEKVKGGRNKQEYRYKIPWTNFVHPSDPIAWPIKGIFSSKNGFDKDTSKLFVVEDKIICKKSKKILKPFHYLISNIGPIGKIILILPSVIYAYWAHSSYWRNKEIANKILINVLKEAERELISSST